MKMNDKIDCSYIPEVLLIGNGIGRSFGASSWEQVIGEMSTGEYDGDEIKWELIKTLPSALQTIVVSSDSVSEGMEKLAEGMMPHPICDEYRDLLLGLIHSKKYDAVLTTNYSYEIETALDPEFQLKKGTASKYRIIPECENTAEKRFGIFRHFEVGGESVYHIHGEAAKSDSMVMGHYYYGKLLAEIEKRVPAVIRAFKACEKAGKKFEPISWIDYFLVGNVHIVGLSLDPSEMDLWWLINCKKRNFADCGKVLFYEPNLDQPGRYAVNALCSALSVESFTRQIKSNGKYSDFYREVVERLREC